MEKLGIIACYNVKINHKLLGYTQRKVMLNLNDSSAEAMRKLIYFITGHPLTIYITIAALGQVSQIANFLAIPIDGHF